MIAYNYYLKQDPEANGPKTVANGEWIRLHNKELHILYRSHNMVRVIKSRRVIWADHVARMEKDSTFKILPGKSTGKRPHVCFGFLF